MFRVLFVSVQHFCTNRTSVGTRLGDFAVAQVYLTFACKI